MGLISDVAKQLDDDAEALWHDYACPLYQSNPVQFIQEGFDSTFHTHVGNVLRGACGAPPPPDQPFTGGQCAIPYHPTWHSRGHDGNGNVVSDNPYGDSNGTLWGPISYIRVREGHRDQVEIGCAVSQSDPTRQNYVVGGGLGAGASIDAIFGIQVNPQFGNIDSCGDLAGSYPPLPQGYQNSEPPRPPILPGRPTGDTPRPPASGQVSNNTLAALIGGLYGALGALAFGIGGALGLLGAENAAGFFALGEEIAAAAAAGGGAQTLGNLLGALGELVGNAIGSGQGNGQTDLSSVAAKIAAEGKKTRDKLDEDKNKKPDDSENFTANTLTENTDSFCRGNLERLRFIGISITSIPPSRGITYGDGTPDRLYQAGWIEFSSEGRYFQSLSISFEHQVFMAPLGATGYCVYIPAGYNMEITEYTEKVKDNS